jgi:putative glutamine amidotransferase
MIRLTTKHRLLEQVPRIALPPLVAKAFQNVVPIRRTERAQSSPSPLPLHTIQFSELGADILLPAVGATPEESFATYRQRLRTSEIFRAKYSNLVDAVKTAPSAPFTREQPVVGIILNDPIVFEPTKDIRDLTREMQELGCRVVLIPPCADLIMPNDPIGRANGIRSMLQRLDGLVGPGGPDVDPSIYARPNRYARDSNVRRDRFEADLVVLAKNESLFMFGICRSHQLWSAADGGDLVQDVQAEGLASMPRNQEVYHLPGDQPLIVRDDAGNVLFEHVVNLDPSSRMAEVTRKTSFLANEFHHQAVKKPGVDLEVVGSSHDPITGRDMIEATERWNGFTVQWHPESMWGDPLQQRLLGTVARRAMLFRAAKNLQEDDQRLTAGGILERGNAQLGWVDPSDATWVRRDLIPHLCGKSSGLRATQGVTRR